MTSIYWSFGASGKEPTCQCRRHKRHGFSLWVRMIPGRRAWQPTAVFLPGESHGQRSLVDYGVAESDTTEATGDTHTWSSGHHLQLPGFALSLTWLKENGGFYRVQKGTVRSLILMMDHLPWDMGHQGRRTDAGRAASDSAMEEPFLPGRVLETSGTGGASVRKPDDMVWLI